MKVYNNSGYNIYSKLIILFWISTLLLFPQDQPEFEHISTIDGLSIGILYHVLKDIDGYLWFATQDGLNRYDGYNFKIFKNNPNNKSSISNSNVSTLCEKDDYLCIGTCGGGLNKFDKSNHFIHFTNNPKDSSSICGDLIQRLFVDQKGTIWIGLQNGLDEFDSKKIASGIF